MKKLLLLSLLCLGMTMNAHTQNWFSDDHRWIFHIGGGFAGFDFEVEMVHEADTIIQGRQSKKWVFNSNGMFTLNPGFTYSDGPRAYAFDIQSDSFVKIYDFSLPVGSQLQMPKRFGVFKYQIDSFDTVQAGSLVLKRQRAHYVDEFGQPTPWKFDILENAGLVGLPFDLNYPACSFVLITDFECNSVADGIDISFLCFSTASGSFNPYGGSCSLVGTGSPEETPFRIRPNPVTEFFEWQLQDAANALQSLVLTDISGKRLKMLDINQTRHSLAGLPVGVYFLEATFDNGQRAVKKILKVNQP